MARVSVLMNCYNGEKYVDQAIQSIYAQSFQDWEIIFIDNCSEDASASIAKSFDSRLKYYRTPKKLSLCEGRVYARPYLRGEFICFLDIDDLWLPNKLERQIAIMEQQPDVGLVYTNTIYFHSLSGKEVLAYSQPMPTGHIFAKLLANYFISLETVMVRKAVMEQHNLFFSSHYNLSSDMEFFVKLSQHTQAHYIDQGLAKWRYGHTHESSSQFLSFPREYERLLKDLGEEIENFSTLYHEAITSLRSKIQNMYGFGYWKEGNRQLARKHFHAAARLNPKYLIPYFASLIMPFPWYNHLRLMKRKV